MLHENITGLINQAETSKLNIYLCIYLLVYNAESDGSDKNSIINKLTSTVWLLINFYHTAMQILSGEITVHLENTHDACIS